MKVAVDNPYVCKDEFIASYEASGLGLSSTDSQYTSGELDRKLLQASSLVNRYCRRWFDTQTIDEQKTGFQVRPYNPQLVTVVLQNRPYSKINSIYIQVLQWFIQIITSPPSQSYLQDFYDKGFYKIVPLLSTAGTGVGSPIPAAILDRVPLGVLWTNYTFGYGTPLTSQALTAVAGTSNLQYQAPLGNRLWAPDQTLNIYENGVLTTKSVTFDYPNGIVIFPSAPSTPVTADFTTNDSLPYDIKEATILVAANLIGQAQNNPTGASNLSIQTYSAGWANGNNKVEERFKTLLEPYVDKRPIILGF